MLHLGVVTDEISRSLPEALAYARAWELRRLELREGSKRRFPHFTDEEMALVEEARAEGARVTAVSPGIFKGAAGDASKLAGELGDTLPRTLDAAQRFECPLVIVFGFERYEGEPASGRTEAMRAFERAADLAHAAGIKIAVENEPNFWIDRATPAAKMLAEIDHPALGLNWDPANQHWGGRAPTRGDFEAVHPHLLNVHVKDYRPGRPRAPWFPLGDGIVPWRELLPWLTQETDLEHLTLETHCEPLVESSQVSLDRLREMLSEIPSENEEGA